MPDASDMTEHVALLVVCCAPSYLLKDSATLGVCGATAACGVKLQTLL